MPWHEAATIFARVKGLLAKAAKFRPLAKITILLTDVRQYAAYNAVCNRDFGAVASPPTSATVGTTPTGEFDAMIEIEGVAVIPG